MEIQHNDLNNCQNRLSMSESTNTSQYSVSLHLLGKTKAYCQSKHTGDIIKSAECCTGCWVKQTFMECLLYKLRDFAQPFHAIPSRKRNDQHINNAMQCC